MKTNKEGDQMTTTINADQIDDAIDAIELKPGITMDTVVKHMDNKIRDAIHTVMHADGQYMSEIGFLRIYIKDHFDKHGEIFKVS